MISFQDRRADIVANKSFVENNRYRVFIKYCVLEYSGLCPFSVLPRSQCVYTHQACRTPARCSKLAEFRKSQIFKEKTQYLMNTLYLSVLWMIRKLHEKNIRDLNQDIWEVMTYWKTDKPTYQRTNQTGQQTVKYKGQYREVTPLK